MPKVRIPRVRNTAVGKPKQLSPKGSPAKAVTGKPTVGGRAATVKEAVKFGLTGKRPTGVSGSPRPAGKRIGPATPSRPAATTTKPASPRAAPSRPSVDFKRQGTRLSRLARR